MRAYFYSLGGVALELKNGCELVDTIAIGNYNRSKKFFKSNQPLPTKSNNIESGSHPKDSNALLAKRSYSQMNSPFPHKPKINKLIHKTLRLLNLKIAYEKSVVSGAEEATKICNT